MKKTSNDEFKFMVSHKYDRNAIQAAPDLRPGAVHPTVVEVQNYLKRYGYLKQNAAVTAGKLDPATITALQKFQQRFNIVISGILDASTRAAMSASRCGLPDVASNRLAFSTIGAWNKRNLTFAFGNFSSDVTNNVARDAVRRAFLTWERAGASLTFREVLSNENHDIFIEWRRANDPDFDMRGAVVAHSDFPPGYSVVVNNPPLPLHFDDQETTWVDGVVQNGIDIETVALHEIGHCLGLLHSDVPGSVMLPEVTSNSTKRQLQLDDIQGILELYPPGELLWYKHNGLQTGANSWAPREGARVGNGLHTFKSVFATSDGVIYAIKTNGDLVWYKHNGLQNGANSWAPNEGAQVGNGWQNFKSVFATSEGVIYAIKSNGDLVWYKHNGRQTGANSWAPGEGAKVGNGWQNFKSVFATSDGIIYAIQPNGDLLWYKHNGWQTGANSWAPNEGAKVGNGWQNFKTVFATSEGIIYAIKTNGDLVWYKHNGRQTGTNSWAPGEGAKVGNGWENFKSVFATSTGIIYGIKP